MKWKGLAYYDPVTDKIHNCKEGTLTYHHEEGHQWVRKKGLTAWIQVIIFFFMILGIGMNSVGEPKMAEICVYIAMGTLAGEEIFAWGFAFGRKWGKKNEGKDNSA